MAIGYNTTEGNSPNPVPKWPNEPEGLLDLIPEDLDGSPSDMLTCTLMRAHGIVSILLAEFMGSGSWRPDDVSIMSALWATQGHLRLAQLLLEKLEEAIEQ